MTPARIVDMSRIQAVGHTRGQRSTCCLSRNALPFSARLGLMRKRPVTDTDYHERQLIAPVEGSGATERVSRAGTSPEAVARILHRAARRWAQECEGGAGKGLESKSATESSQSARRSQREGAASRAGAGKRGMPRFRGRINNPPHLSEQGSCFTADG